MEDTQTNRIRFASLMGKLGIAYRVDTSKELLQVYWEFLSDRSMYQVESAITDMIKSGERFPTVSQVRAMASGYREFKTVAVEPRPMIEEFTTVDDMPVDAAAFFEKVGGYFK